MNKPAVQMPRINGMRPVAPEVIHYPYQEQRPSIGGSGHLHWTLQAFSRLQDDGSMSDVVPVNCLAWAMDPGACQSLVMESLSGVTR